MFHISARATTDLWRKPPSLDVDNAPRSSITVPASQFHRARVTVSASWTRLYDQGGLYVKFPQSAGHKRFWLKTGIEFYDGQSNLSTVAAREWADWSLVPLSGDSATVLIEREKVDAEAGTGSSLWVYLLEGDKKMAVREVTWAFETDEGDLEVGWYAARPTKIENEDGEPLVVNFDQLLIE